jgi:hypothetical protein
MVSGQADRFAADLVRLASKPEVRAEIGRLGSEVARDVDVANTVERLGDLYRSLMN